MSLVYDIKKKGDKLTVSGIRYCYEKGERTFTYELRDYGGLAYWLRQYGNVDGDTLWMSIDDMYALDRSSEERSKRRERWIRWHLDKLQEIEATTRVEKDKYRLGKLGKLAFDVARRTSDWTVSLEAIIIARLIATKIDTLGYFLQKTKGQPTKVSCRKKPKKVSLPEDFEIAWDDLSTGFRDVYFLHAEPYTIPDLRSPAVPTILSGLIFNEIFSIITHIRGKIIERIAKLGNTADFYTISDRGSNEIKRALKHIGILRIERGTWFTCIPDRLLSNLALYALRKKDEQVLPIRELSEVMKNDFRLLVDPDHVDEFLDNSVDFETLGLDRDILRNNLEQVYADFVKRLVSLGYGNIRPDGEVTIEVPRLR